MIFEVVARTACCALSVSDHVLCVFVFVYVYVYVYVFVFVFVFESANVVMYI